MEICSIYKITNSINNKIYIGQTWNTIQYRFAQHINPANKRCIKLHLALNKYGREIFQIECIAACSDQITADYLETTYIKEHDSIKNGYNIREGGSHGKHSYETIKKMKLAQQGFKNHRFGKKNSEEHKQKMIAATKTLEYAVKMSQIKKGHLTSDETKKKISEAQKGQNSKHKNETWKIIDGKRVWLKKEEV